MDLLWWFEANRTSFFDTIFSSITRLGEEMSLIAIFCIIFWCVNKKMAYVVGYSFFLSGLIVQGMKILFRVPRPWVYDATFEPVGGSIAASTGYAFPSGHTQNAAALLGGIGIVLKKNWLKIILYVLALLVGFSRLYLGVHYLEDVLVSLLITFVIVFFVNKFISDEQPSKTKQLLLSGVLALFAVAVIFYATYLYHTGLTVPSQLRDSTRIAGAAIGFAVGMYIEQMHIKFSPKSRNIPLHILKIILGVAGMIAIQEGFRLLGTGLVMDAIRYFLVVIWITVFYPLIIKRFFDSTIRQTSILVQW